MKASQVWGSIAVASLVGTRSVAGDLWMPEGCGCTAVCAAADPAFVQRNSRRMPLLQVRTPQSGLSDAMRATGEVFPDMHSGGVSRPVRQERESAPPHGSPLQALPGRDSAGGTPVRVVQGRRQDDAGDGPSSGLSPAGGQ